MVKMREWHPLLQFLSETLGYEIRALESTLGYELYEADLSSWKLRLTDHTPIIWVKGADLANTSPRELLQSLQDVTRKGNLTGPTSIVLLDGDSQPLIEYTRSPLYSFAFVGQEEQDRIMHSRRPSGELLDIIAAQIPISNLAPYETSAPVMGSRFFGREYELRQILGHPDTNYLVLGIRRIGKTSLLHELRRVLTEKEDAPHIVYLDCSELKTTGDYVREAVRALEPRELPRLEMRKYVFFFPNFLERMRLKYKRRIVFILDEIDNLVLNQRGDWDLFQTLRSSSNKQACQYILAGYREAMLEQSNMGSPLFNFAHEVALNEFTWQQAHDLIVTPMENLRIRFHNKDEVVGRIYEETAGHPNLIQYYCTVLIKHLDQSGKRELGPDNLLDIYNDSGFRNHLLSSFMQNTHNREKAIIYSLICSDSDCDRGQSFTQKHMDACLRKQGIEMVHSDIDTACNTLRLAGILHNKNAQYFFNSPVFVKMLRQQYDPVYLLNKVKEERL